MISACQDRVVVTGLGVVAPAGVGVNAFWTSILKGVSHIRAHTYFPQARIRGKAGGLVEFESDTMFSWSAPPGNDGDDRLFHITATAIDEALVNAGIAGEARARLLADAGLYISSAIGPVATMIALVRDGARGIAPTNDSWRAFSFGRFGARVAEQFGIGGPYAVLPTGCTGGCDAVGYALSAIRNGSVDIAVVGGFDAPITPLVEAAFARINATSSRDCPADEASCPFDMQRDGFVLGEGAGALVMERESAALARGATPIGVIAGYGSVCSGFHMTDIHPSGEAIARSIELALKDANIAADDIDHVNLHGSSTPMNDVAEANALCKLLGNSVKLKPVTSIKSQIGHAMAAASAIELAAVVMTLIEQVIPPTANLTDQDPRIDLAVVSGEPRHGTIRTVLKTASSFSGIHSAIVVSRYGA
jgi:3-oxoacyl-(acyl-carrier-protein) synthase